MSKRNLTYSALAVIVLLCFTVSCRKSSVTSVEKTEPSSLVPKDLARSVAEKFPTNLFSKNNNPAATPDKPNRIVSDLVYNDGSGFPAMYVFNFEKGFLFVSADFNIRPVLAYIDNGNLLPGKIPEGMQDWVNTTIENVELVRTEKYDNAKEGKLSWSRYLAKEKIIASEGIRNNLREFDPCTDPLKIQQNGKEAATLNTLYSYYQVGPLLPVTWGQSCTYNNKCALTQTFNCNSCFNNVRPVTGCVATAMAQVINYHHFPSSYNYSLMPSNTGSNEVQNLMRDAGVAVSMSYGCSGSSAYGSAVPGALKNTFGYSSANRNNYNWSSVHYNISMYNLPVLLEGTDQATSDAHEWVADGIFESTYTDCTAGWSVTYLYFHMNWGWHEDILNLTGGTDYNGWFAFDNWTVSGINRNFSYASKQVTEIHP